MGKIALRMANGRIKEGGRSQSNQFKEIGRKEGEQKRKVKKKGRGK